MDLKMNQKVNKVDKQKLEFEGEDVDENNFVVHNLQELDQFAVEKQNFEQEQEQLFEKVVNVHEEVHYFHYYLNLL